MIPAVTALTGLAAAGKAVQHHHRRPPAASASAAAPPPRQHLPEHPYNQRHYEQACAHEAEAQRRNFLRAHGNNTNVVPNNVKRLDALHRGPFYSELAGADIDGGFTHSNMQPFIGARHTQDLRLDRDPRRLEAFTGGNPLHRDKEAVPALFAPTPNMSYVGGTPASTAFQQARMQEGQAAALLRHNELPFQQVRVGKGLGLGYTAEPAGGLNQAPGLDLVPGMYKSVDELRVASKPKTTFSLPLKPGGVSASAAERAPLPRIEQHRPPLVQERCPEDLLPSAGPGTFMQAARPEVVQRPTDRALSEAFYVAPAAPARGGAPAGSLAQHRDSPRRRADAEATTGPTNARTPHAAGLCDDYGAAGIELPVTSREFLVEVPGRLGALTSAVKALVAPVVDAIRATRKDSAVQGHRDFGALQVQAPPRPTVAPQHAPLPTLKDTNLHDAERLNLRGPTRPTVVDVTQVARTTVRETLLQDLGPGNFGNGPRCVGVYVAGARTTGRETLPEAGFVRNARTVVDRGVIRATDETARVTVRETTLIEDYTGHARVANGAAYDTAQQHELPSTNRELGALDGTRYGGGRVGNAAGAYGEAAFEMPATNRELGALEGERYGGAGPGAAGERPGCTAAYEAARSNDARELTLLRDEPPAPSGPKLAAGADAMNVEPSRPEVAPADRASVADRVLQVPLGAESLRLTAEPTQSPAHGASDRILSEVAEQVRSNPFALRV